MLYDLSDTMYLRRVVTVIFKGSLRYYFSAVELLIDIVDSDSIHLHPIFHSLLHRPCTAKRRKKRRVNIDYPSTISIQKDAANYPHITGQTDKFHTACLHHGYYLPLIVSLAVIRNCDVHGVAHITGGGFDENIPRVLHDGQGLEIHEGTWEILPVFRMLEKWGGVPHREMFNIFNMGIGMVVVMDESEAGKAIEILESHGEKASIIGKVTDVPGVNIVLK